MNSIFMKMKHAPQKRFHRERGVVLIITLLILLAMILTTAGILRSTDTSTMAVANLSFQQAANASLDRGIETTVMQLVQQAATTTSRTELQNNGTFNGYFAFIQPGENTQGIPLLLQTRANAGGANVMRINDDMTGNRISIVVERLCTNIGATIDNPDNRCFSRTTSGGGGSLVSGQNKAMQEALPDLSGNGAIVRTAYRITARADGVKNAVAFAQALIYI
jgi:hypothetical protein